jgi:alkylation response protein AidB-like acyl-CoA dehydrogenase
MLVPTLLELGTEAQKREYIAPRCAASSSGARAIRSRRGSDLASLQTRAVEDGDDFVVNGQKIWTSTAHEADMIFCLVRTEPTRRSMRHQLPALLDADARHLDAAAEDDDGRAEFNEVFFTDVRVPRHRSSARAAKAGR